MCTSTQGCIIGEIQIVVRLLMSISRCTSVPRSVWIARFPVSPAPCATSITHAARSSRLRLPVTTLHVCSFLAPSSVSLVLAGLALLALLTLLAYPSSLVYTQPNTCSYSVSYYLNMSNYIILYQDVSYAMVCRGWERREDLPVNRQVPLLLTHFLMCIIASFMAKRAQ